MATAVNTTVTELPESRVSVDVEIAADEIQRTLENQARKLGQEMKVPGFRTGKIPPAVVIQRIGRESILDEAVRGRLTDWYLKAVEESGIAPVGDPEVDLGYLPPAGKPCRSPSRSASARRRSSASTSASRCRAASPQPIGRQSTSRSTRCVSASLVLRSSPAPPRT